MMFKIISNIFAMQVETVVEPMYKIHCDWDEKRTEPLTVYLREGRENTGYYEYRVPKTMALYGDDLQWLKDNVKVGWAIISDAGYEEDGKIYDTVLGFADEDMAMAFKLGWS